VNLLPSLSYVFVQQENFLPKPFFGGVYHIVYNDICFLSNISLELMKRYEMIAKEKQGIIIMCFVVRLETHDKQNVIV
jgi:hypothetical protein